MWPRKYIYQYPDGGDGNGNGGGGGQTPEEVAAAAAAASEARFAALEKAIGVIASGHESLTQSLTGLTAKQEQLLERLASGGGGNSGGGSSGGGGDDVDLETMDRKQFASHILSQMKGVVEETLKPLGEKFGALDQKIDGTSLSIMIKEFQKDHPDFFEWKEEMRGLLKDNPTLTPARAYALARAENPEKVVKIDAKYGLGKDKSKPNGSDNILSLFPQGGSATKSGAGKMNPKQAAEAAWDQVMSSLGNG